jgi:carbamoyl-phosphate synthase small subunit
MKFGHHGGNHPVLDLDSGRVMISSQNHGFAVDEATLAGQSARHAPLSVRRHACKASPALTGPRSAFQGHPEASPGPHDVAPLFDRFIALLEARAPRGLDRLFEPSAAPTDSPLGACPSALI